MEELELICFQLITAAGEAKSAYMEAVSRAKKGLFDEARQLIEKGNQKLIQGHKPHTDLIQKEAAGDDLKVSLILLHAEDQMMSSECFCVMAEEMIALYELLYQKQ